MAYRDGRFFIVSGLPEGYEENYVYEYDGDFNFIERHVISSSHTHLGIQTACHAHGYFWFGCYGYPDNTALLMTDDSFNLVSKHDTHASVGITGLRNSRFLQGFSVSESKGKWRGKARIIRYDRSLSGRFVMVKTP